MASHDGGIYHIPITQHYDSNDDEEEDVGDDLPTENVADAPPAETVEHPNVDDAAFQHLLKYSTWNTLQHSVATLVLIPSEVPKICVSKSV
jgi:hypothetical protein